ncbi:MAG: hypothetical protein ACP5N2_07525 [Candidatus Nanoarchaeia archaeon]
MDSLNKTILALSTIGILAGGIANQTYAQKFKGMPSAQQVSEWHQNNSDYMNEERLEELFKTYLRDASHSITIAPSHVDDCITEIDGVKYIRVKQIGSDNVLTEEERTRDRSTTFRGLFGQAGDRYLNDWLNAISLSTNVPVEKIKLHRISGKVEDFVADVQSSYVTNHRMSDGTIVANHILFKRGEEGLIPLNGGYIILGYDLDNFNKQPKREDTPPVEPTPEEPSEIGGQIRVRKLPLTDFTPKDQYQEPRSQDKKSSSQIDHSGAGLIVGMTNMSLLQIGLFLEAENGFGVQAFYIAPFGSNTAQYEGTKQDKKEVLLDKTEFSEITRRGTANIVMRTFGADITKTIGDYVMGDVHGSVYLITGYRASMLKANYDWDDNATEKLRTFVLNPDGTKQDVDINTFNIRDTDTKKMYEQWLHSVNVGIGFENGPFSFAFNYAIPLDFNGFKDHEYVPGEKDFATNNVLKNKIPQYDGPDSKPLKYGPGNFVISAKINMGWKNPNKKFNSGRARDAQGYHRR